MARAIFYVEKECGGQRIDEDYPWIKFASLLEFLMEHAEKEKREMDRASMRR